MPKEAKPRTVKVAKKVVEKAEKPAKKVKDPNAPKRPLSAYMYFSSAQRATVKEENPEASFGTCPSRFSTRRVANIGSLCPGDLGKLLGAKWKEMVEEDRKVRRPPLRGSDF